MYNFSLLNLLFTKIIQLGKTILKILIEVIIITFIKKIIMYIILLIKVNKCKVVFKFICINLH